MSEERERFDELFQQLAGFSSNEAEVGSDGFLFIPPQSDLDKKPLNARREISQLAGPNGWRNHLENDDYAGWWIRRP